MKKIIIVFTLIFLLKITSSFAQYTKIHDFDGGQYGGYPFSNLFFDGTYLYGVTVYGGIYNNGVIFKVKPNGTDYTKIFDFNYLTSGYNAYGTLISDGTFLYGTTKGNDTFNIHGTVYKIKPDGTDFTTLFTFNGLNGSTPWSGLYLNGQFLYGMTNYGGTGSGTIYKITTSGTNFETLLNFTESTTGEYPYGELIYDGTFLYGTTSGGGLNYGGTVFKILTDGSGYTKLVDFSNAPNGNYPYGSLVTDGTFLYGTTGTGGINNIGSIFKVKPDGTQYQQLFSFNGNNGQQPMDNLVILGDYIYGMTMFGGINSIGTIFRIKPDGSEFSKLLDFDGTTHGSYPRRSLISDGTFLYGMTSSGGENGNGVIFKFSPQNLDNTEFNILSDITIYPNPSNGLIKIETQSITKLQIEVYNILGELITQQFSLNQQTIIDLTNYSAGVYIVKIHYNDNKIVHEKIVIK
ncbi:MAG: choice-of-anchor tandem repeat GloVer-containing protein [Flavobacterium sp.]|uniref:choice-of-anchor tandem repeat GloVer-containing protein n=1 Tax=Flavobacterium sp. TaxID=239 RepID=UPI003788C2D1